MMLAAQAYLYKLARFYLPSTQAEYVTTRATLTTFTVVAFLLLLCTFGVGIRCFLDFDKGLLASKVNALPKRTAKLDSADSKPDMNQRYSAGVPVAARISIE
ncbi:hypothetical protein H0H92_002671 [Tricholoma furcatifolium]|nr:hypothetical protein H0H92_002671 [Tricholoma furcatifolium]